MAFAYFIIMSVYITSNIYIGRRIFLWLRLLFPRINGWACGIVYACFAASIPMGILLTSMNIMAGEGSALPSGIAEWIGRSGDYWMGLFFYLFLLWVTADIILWIGRLVRLVPAPMPKKLGIWRGAVVLLTVAGLFTYGRIHASQFIKASYTIQIEKDTALEQLNIVLVSDLHLGFINDVDFLERVVNDINALEADIVCMVGDIFNSNYYALSDPEEGTAWLRRIQSTYGVYACLGNHDAGSTFNEMIDFLDKGNVTILNDEYVVVDNKFILAGRKDSSPIGGQGGARKDVDAVFDGMDKDMPVIVMDHQPTNRGEYGDEVDLMMSGHTHRGHTFPVNVITDITEPLNYGYYPKTGSEPPIIVTSGVGIWGPPLRIGTDSEIVSVLLEFKPGR